MNKEEWLERAMNGDTVNEMATKAGISSATAWRQYNNALGFTAENVILIARAYKKSPIEGLVAFGYIREDELDTAEKIKALSLASDQDLLDEIARRLKKNGDNPAWNKPIIISDDDDDDDVPMMSEEERLNSTLGKLNRNSTQLAALHDENKLKEREYDADQGA